MANQRRKARSRTIFSAKVTTTISIALVLFLLGLTILTALAGGRVSSFVKENLSISLVLPDNLTPQEVDSLQKELRQKPYIHSVQFVSKAEIKKQLIEDLGRDPEAVLGYNPASNCFDVTLHSAYANPDSIKIVEQELKGRQLVQNVMYSEADLRMVNANLSKIGMALLIFATLLMIISFALVRNTIRLNIYSRRFLIHTMRLVGATGGFIRKPFVKGMVLSGIVAAILANLGIAGLVYYFVYEYPDLLGSIVVIDDLIVVGCAVLLLGILLTLWATIFAVNRYLRMHSDKYYHI